MSEDHRATARGIAHIHLAAGDPLGWFEDLYSQAGDDPSIIPSVRRFRAALISYK